MNIPLYELLDLLSKAYASLRKHKHATWDGPEIAEFMKGCDLGIAERFQAESVQRAWSDGRSLLQIVLGAAYSLGQSRLLSQVAWQQNAAVLLIQSVLKDLDPQSPHAKTLQQVLNLMMYPPE
jgi:hypothetical protein